MGVWFESSHPGRDYAGGQLRVGVGIEDEALGQTRYDEVVFSVPPDFYAHNDLVATALMTLVGRTSPDVRFNFPISQRCAEILSIHYNLTEVGPVDPSLEPRQPGKYLGLSLSGGLDSASVLVLLRHIGVECKVITSDYGRRFARDRLGYEQFPRDVTCTTNLRECRLDRRGRFHYAAPLLYADYLDLYGVTTGHNLHHGPPQSIEPLDRGQEPAFLVQDRAILAGGLEDVHLIRALTLIGSMKILLTFDPACIEAALDATGPPTNMKRFTKAVLIRWLCEQTGRAVPAYLESIAYPSSVPPFGSAANDYGAVLVARYFDGRTADGAASGLSQADLSSLRDLTLDFYGKYNTNFIRLIPTAIRDRVLDGFHRCGIYPYDERDWREFGVVRELLYTVQDPNIQGPRWLMNRPSVRPLG